MDVECYRHRMMKLNSLNCEISRRVVVALVPVAADEVHMISFDHSVSCLIRSISPIPIKSIHILFTLAVFLNVLNSNVLNVWNVRAFGAHTRFEIEIRLVVQMVLNFVWYGTSSVLTDGIQYIA
eukprot:305457_1